MKDQTSSLGAKTMLIATLTTVSIMVLLYVPLRLILLGSFRELEEQALRRDIHRARNEIVDTIEALSSFNSDYAYWDDTYAFMLNRDTDYLASNLVESTYTDSHLNVIMLIEPFGEIIYGEAYDLDAETFIALPDRLKAFALDNGVIREPDTTSHIAGILWLPEAPLFIAVRPVLTSEREGPPRGALLMARFLNETEQKRLAETTALSLSFSNVKDLNVSQELAEARDRLLQSEEDFLIRPLNAKTIAGYTLLDDVYDQPAILLRIDTSRDIYARGKTTLSYMGLSILIAGLVFGMVIRWLLTSMILSRLEQLSNRVSQIGAQGVTGDFSQRISIRDNDELTRLGSDINGMLDNLEHYQHALLVQKQRFEDLVAVAHATVERPTLDATLRNALEVARQLTDAERGSLFLLDEVGTVTYSMLARKYATPAEQKELVGQVMRAGLAGWVAQHREAALVHNTAQDDRWLTLPNEPYVARSVLAVPILSGQNKVGILTLTHPDIGHFNQDSLALMQGAADQMALAIRNAQIYENQRRLAERQTTLYEVLNAISTHLNPATVLNLAVETVAERTAWPVITIFLYDEIQRELTIRATNTPPPITSGKELFIEQGIVGRAFQLGETQYVSDVHADPNYIAWHQATNSELAVPLRFGEQVLGVLNIEHTREGFFRAEDIVLAESLADAIALAITNAELFQAATSERSRLEALIAASQEGILFIDVNMTIMVINAAALNMLALPSQPERWIHQSALDLLNALRHHAPDAARNLLHELRRIQKGDETARDGEATVAMRTLHWLNLPVVPKGKPLGRLIMMRDITEDRLLEQMRDDLTHTMVHDLRNPLTGMYSAIKLLMRRAANQLSPNDQQMLEIADNNAQRMLRLVNAILDISRLESGQMPVDCSPMQLHDVTHALINLQQPLADSKRVHLATTLQDDLPTVWADPDLIERVFQNLISNALKFTPEGGEVHITARYSPENAGKVYISINDTGPGIPSEIRERLFEKFTTGQQQERGTGLGLTFCKMALVAHGEDIWVEHTSRRGTTFTFTLPIAPAAHPSEV